MKKVFATHPKGPWHDAGALLSWAALLLAALAQLLGETEATVAGLAFFVAGLAHGAGDENDATIRPFSLIHVGAYLVTGAAVTALFLVAPPAGLALFLALSAWHFARSDVRMAQETRFAIAALATGGSALFRHRETERVFAAVVGEPLPPLFVDVLALAGIVGIGLAGWVLFKGRRGSGHAAIAAGAVALLHPVLAVGLIFLTAHAVPIQQRQIRRYGSAAVWKAVAWPSVVALAGAAGLAVAVWQGWIALPIAVALAFGMATPHMLTERLER